MAQQQGAKNVAESQPMRQVIRKASTLEMVPAAEVPHEPIGQEKPLVILVVGECGDGKSTVINNLVGKNLAKTGKAARGVTKDIEVYEAKIDGRLVYVIDTPGIGDQDVDAMTLLSMIENHLKDGTKLNGVVVTSPVTDGRVKLGAQVVQALVDKGFMAKEKWQHVILNGTKKDRADSDELEFFSTEVRNNFFRDAAAGEGILSLTGKEDISELTAAFKKLPKAEVQYEQPDPEVMSAALANKMGLSEDIFKEKLNTARAEVEAEAEKAKQAMEEKCAAQADKEEAMRAKKEAEARAAAADMAKQEAEERNRDAEDKMADAEKARKDAEEAKKQAEELAEKAKTDFSEKLLEANAKAQETAAAAQKFLEKAAEKAEQAEQAARNAEAVAERQIQDYNTRQMLINQVLLRDWCDFNHMGWTAQTVADWIMAEEACGTAYKVEAYKSNSTAGNIFTLGIRSGMVHGVKIFDKSGREIWKKGDFSEGSKINWVDATGKYDVRYN